MRTHCNILFLCTGNSARSIMAEAIMNAKGGPDFTAFSAGSHPSGAVRPEAIRRLAAAGIPAEGLRSKSWEEFSQPNETKMDFVVTVCDNAANEVCPMWPGHPVTEHWPIPDPTAVKGTDEEVQAAFRNAFLELDERISTFLVRARGNGAGQIKAQDQP